MAQDFVDATYDWLLSSAGLFKELLWFLLSAVVAGAVVWLAYRRLDPDDATGLRARLAASRKWAVRLVPLALLVTLLSAVLVQSRQLVSNRRETLEQATASRRNEPQLSGVVQYAPSVAFMEDRTYRRTLTLPPQMVDRLGTEGLQVLAPYLSDPSADDVMRMVDSFKRSGKDVVFTRELTRRDEVPIAADSANVQVDFKDVGTPNGQRHYDVTFVGAYRFHNPNPTPATMRFNFPPPQGGGTIQGFYFDAAGRRVTEPDDHGLYVWSAIVPPGGAVEAVAHYEVTGGGAYDYLLGSERRRIGSFRMAASAGHLLQFGRSGIFPSQVNGRDAEWQLHDVLTAQSIQLQFPRTDLQAQLLDKTLSVLPLALVLFSIGALLLRPNRSVLAAAAFGVGLLSIPVLSSYCGPVVATEVGAGLAFVAAGLLLGALSGWILAAIGGCFVCSFLTVEHASLVVWGLTLLVLVSIALQAKTHNPKSKMERAV